MLLSYTQYLLKPIIEDNVKKPMYVQIDRCVHADSPGKNTGVGCHSLLQGIVPTQESNWCQLHCGWILYQPYQGSLDKHNGRECKNRICIYIQIDIFLRAQLVKNPPAMQETPVGFLDQEDPLEKGQATNPVLLGFPYGSAGKESSCSTGDLDLIPGLGRFPGEGKGYPLQYSGLENSMDCIVCGVAKSWTRLTFTNMNSPISIKETEFCS